MNWFLLFAQLAPTLLSLIPGLQSHPAVVSAIVKGIPEAAAIPGATNEQKKAHVLQLVADAAPVINEAEGHTAVDATNLTAVASAAIDTTIGVVNLIHQAHGDGSPNQTQPQIPPAA